MKGSDVESRPIALVGLRCSGKSSVGKLLAERLRCAFVDLDTEVVRFARHSGFSGSGAGELIGGVGWARFRELEANTLKKLIEPMPRIVLATGGGVCDRADNRAWLVRATHAFYLDVPIELLQLRLQSDSGVLRPPLMGGKGAADAVEEMPRVAPRRDPLYRSVGRTIDCADRTASELSELVAHHLIRPAE